MHVVFFNPQGNFDPDDSHLTEHPDFLRIHLANSAWEFHPPEVREGPDPA